MKKVLIGANIGGCGKRGSEEGWVVWREGDGLWVVKAGVGGEMVYDCGVAKGDDGDL